MEFSVEHRVNEDNVTLAYGILKFGQYVFIISPIVNQWIEETSRNKNLSNHILEGLTKDLADEIIRISKFRMSNEEIIKAASIINCNSKYQAFLYRLSSLIIAKIELKKLDFGLITAYTYNRKKFAPVV